MIRVRPAVIALLIACVMWLDVRAQQGGTAPRDVPAPYMSTRDQTGHELVKTEQFVVPVGTTVVIPGLEFDISTCALNTTQERIMAQVFNSLEEITENTVNDTDPKRVAEFKQMRFEIRGYSAFAGSKRKDKALSTSCATVIMNFLTISGTPAWRLRVRGRGQQRSEAGQAAPTPSTHQLSVDFVRIK